METKQFHIRTILSVTTHRLLTISEGPNDNGIADMYRLLGWMTTDEPFTHQLPRFAEECGPWLIRWFPELQRATDELPLLDMLLEQEPPESAVEAWMLEMQRHLKLVYDVPKIPADDHVRKHFYDELVEMRGTDEGIVIVDPGDKHDAADQ